MSGYTGKTYLGKPTPPHHAPGIDGSLKPELSCQYCKDTDHSKESCVKLNRRTWTGYLPTGKLRPPLVMDQTRGDKKSGPHTNHEEKEKDLICQINNAPILAETKNGDYAMSCC